MKKFLSALSMIALLTVLFAISVSAAEPVKTWDVSANGDGSVTAYLYNDPKNTGYYTLTISGTGEMQSWLGTYYVPWYSSYWSKITSVTIENGVTSIGSYAFYSCTYLTSVVIPDSVTSIGEHSFKSCRSLTSVEIPDSVTSIGESAFSNCAVTSVKIPDGVTSIMNSTFSGSAVTSVVIPNCVTSIGSNAFSSCQRLTSVEIPNSVISIGESAFYDCRHLTSIVIPDSVISIGEKAFSNCEDLTSIVIPNSVTSIGEKAFHSCQSLTSVRIGGGVATTGYWAFASCPSLESVVIDNGVTSIGEYLFESCWSLTSVEIPDSVTSIGKGAFSTCKSLANVKIPDSVISIGIGAFMDCSSLTSVVIPNSVTSIGVNLFTRCPSLTSIIVEEDNKVYKSIDGNVYTKDEKTIVIYACGKKDAQFVIPNSVTSIGSYAFSECDFLTSVILTNSVTSIASNAFANCDTLASVLIPNSVTSIGSKAFTYYCDSLTIYCEAESQPSGWDNDWKQSSYPVVWAHKHAYIDEECECGKYNGATLLEEMFTFKGYSFGFAGQITFGYDINYEVLELYKNKTGEKPEIGVVFVAYNNLNGTQPLDEKGQAREYVVKQELTVIDFTYYNFIIANLRDNQKDVKLVIATYIYDGEKVKYIQENGISDTVTGVSYNEAKESVA